MSTELEPDNQLRSLRANGSTADDYDAQEVGTRCTNIEEVKTSEGVATGAEAETESNTNSDSSFQWTAKSAVLSVVLFVVAGICEIGGGWMVWKAVREGKQFWWAIIGSVILIGYGFIPTLQPTSSFGRVYAVYGGFFIILSFLWGWALDGERPDVGDAVGCAVSLVGVILILFWPR